MAQSSNLGKSRKYDIIEKLSNEDSNIHIIYDNMDYMSLKHYSMISDENKERLKDYLSRIAIRGRKKLGSKCTKDLNDHELVERLYHMNDYIHGSPLYIRVNDDCTEWKSIKNNIQINIVANKTETWIKNGKYYRIDGPAKIQRYPSGNKKAEYWYIDGLEHRENSPSRTNWYEDGRKKYESWHKDGKRHRERGPALTRWYENGTKASEIWYINEFRHRVEGPAHIAWNEDGSKKNEFWWRNGRMIHILDQDPSKAFN